MRIGLFFGSFNPIHLGHLIIASSVAELAEVKEIWFVVSPQNPLKKPGSLAHEQDRYDMVQLAVGEDYRFRASDIEFSMPKPSYTIDTLTYLSERYPQHEFRLILGEDNLGTFHKWKNHQLIVENYGLIIYPRPGAKPSSISDHPNITIIEAPLLQISATFIRKLIQKNKSIKYLVPQEVESFIRLKKLYEN